MHATVGNRVVRVMSLTCVSTSQMNIIVLRVPQSGMKTWCWLEFISRIISCVKPNCYQHAWKQNLVGDKNNPKITLTRKFLVLLTVKHTILIMLVWRIWYWINKLSPNWFSFFSSLIWLILHSFDIVGRNSFLQFPFSVIVFHLQE